MKQTIISKCFDKMKRVVLTLFAALCVGSVWAEEGEVTYVTTPLEDPSAGYIRSGLGDGNEVAVVFTNHTKTATWTVPANLYNVQFLVVGGGGGGGGGTSRSSGTRLSPGGGGGGGGVATGIVENLAIGSAFKVKVGNGGSAGPAGTGGGGSGAAGAAEDTTFGVGDSTYITAKAGGSGVGYDHAPGTGASVSGRRYEVGSTASKLESGAIVGDGAPLNDVYITPGGSSGASGGESSKRAAGGGGGAMADGGAGSTTSGGIGGIGYESSISGQTLVYGSGGGGGGYGIPGGSAGGDDAGAGSTSNGTAGSALANRGGGGGGGGVKNTSSRGAGGAGGSGVVVLRFVNMIDYSVVQSKIKDKNYNGSVQYSSLVDTFEYTVREEGQINVGSYSVFVTPICGFWSDTNTQEEREFTWSIVQAENEWTSVVSIDKKYWTVGIDDEGEISLPTLKFGDFTAMISKDGAEAVAFDGTMPKESGVYVVTYYPETTDDYTSENLAPQTISFTVYTPEAIPDYSFVAETYSVGAECKAVIPYEVVCEATSTKSLSMYVCYNIVGEDVVSTNLVREISGIRGSGNCEISDLKPGAKYIVSFFGDVEGTLSELTEPLTVTVPSAASNLTASSTFVNNPMEFRVSGSVVPGLGTTVVKVYWALNDDSQLETNEPKEFAFTLGENGVELGQAVEFVATIPYYSAADRLFWRVGVENSVTTDTWGTQTFAGPVTEVVEKVRKDVSSVRYSWTGKGTPNEAGVYSWTDIANWSSSVAEGECIGYPGTFANNGASYKYYASVLHFTQAGEGQIVDLGGNTYTMKDAGDGFVFDEGARLTLTNGKINVNCDTFTIGAPGSLIEFKNVDVTRWSINKDGSLNYHMRPDVVFAAGSTNIFSGTMTLRWFFTPASGAGSKLVLRDGTLTTTGYKAQNPTEGTEVEINNAVWRVETTMLNGVASVLKFRDGVDRRARIYTTTQVNLNGVYDIKLPEVPYQDSYSYAEYNSLGTADTCSFRIDATDFVSDAPVALIKFNGTVDEVTKSAMNTLANAAEKLTVVVEGVEIDKSTRNARLVWVEGAKTLYYQQDLVGAVASIGDTKYETLEAAIEAAGAGDTVKLVADIAANTAIVVTKAVTVDLNGKKIQSNDTDAATDGNGVFWVKQGGVLTIVGEGTVDGNGGNGYKMAVWADGGKVVINGGTYVNLTDGTHPQYDLIYVKNGGIVEINGGTFMCQTTRWTLNSNNKSPGRFVVKGGKFLGYDPSNFNTDEADVTNWCADGYTVVEGQDADAGYYIVVENPAIAPDGLTEVAADSPEAAAAKVAIKVPDAMNGVVSAKDYAEYFTKTAEYNETTGKYMVTAALNPVVVKPVIAETTADDATKEAFVIDADGNVTLNISNKKPGLYYGVQVLKELGADPVAVVPETEVGTLVVPAENLPDGNAAFFKVVVDFAPIVVPEAE